MSTQIPHLGTVPDIQLPPRDELDGLAVATAVDEYLAARAEFHRALSDANALAAEADRIDAEDRAKTAQAIAAAKKYEPGKAQAAHAAKVERAALTARAHGDVAAGKYAALVAALQGAEGAEAQVVALERHEENRRALLALVQDVQDALKALDVSAALEAFFTRAQDAEKVTPDGSPRPYSAPRPAAGAQLAAELRGYGMLADENLREMPSEPANLAIVRTIIDARAGMQGEDRARFVEWMGRTFGEPVPNYPGDWAEFLIAHGLTQAEAVAWKFRGVPPERRADREPSFAEAA